MKKLFLNLKTFSLFFMMLISSLSFAQSGGDCDCSGEEPLVCAYDENGEVVVLSECMALCLEYEITDCDSLGGEFACLDCLNEGIDPVCAVDSSGEQIFLPNLCYAECLGYELVECDTTGCNCPEIYDPVCATDPATGDTLTFDNSCFAECGGYIDWFVCDGQADCESDCPDVDEPVCVVIDSSGSLLEFRNECVANCAGFFEFVDCDDDGFAGGFNPLDNRLSKFVANTLTRDQVELRISSTTELDTRLEVVSYQGARILSQALHLVQGDNTVIIRLENQTPGMYFIKVPDVNKNHIVKVLLLD